MDRMAESMRSLAWVKIVVQIVYVHHAIAEAPSRGDVEVAYYFVDAETALDSASLVPLCFQLLRVMFSFALFNPFAFAKSPRNSGICFSYFFARLTAAWLGSRRWRRRSIAFAAIGRIQMTGLFIPVA